MLYSTVKEIYFVTETGNLIVKTVFLNKLIANYKILLREKDRNAQTTLADGDNTNPLDDIALLPSPVSNNHGRRIVLETGFSGIDHTNFLDYEIRLEVFQNGVKIGLTINKGKLDGKGEYSLLFIKPLI